MHQNVVKAGLLLLLLAVLSPAGVLADWQRQEAAIMGTAIAVELWHEDEAQGKALIRDIMAEMRRIDQLMSTYKPDSELSFVNKNAANGPVTVSKELLALIERSLEYSNITTGAFDITYASAGKYYDYRNNKRPDDEQLQSVLPAIDYRHVKTDHASSSIQFLHPDVYIDLGGIAKGYAVDRGMALIQQAGVTTALVSAGGDTRVIGKRWDRPWHIGIRNPRDEENIISMIPLENSAISTSGDYERYYEINAQRFSHIINPITGYPQKGVVSATVIAPTAQEADVLSTALCVLGGQRGSALIDRMDERIAALIIEYDSSNRARHYMCRGYKALRVRTTR